MKKLSFLIMSWIAITVVACHAQSLFSSTTSPDAPAGNRGPWPYQVGNQFTVGENDLLVTQLGYEDAGLDGLLTSHLVQIWTEAGDLVTSITVPAGEEAPLLDAWRYATLGSAVTLSAGQTYRIAGVASGDNFTDSASPGNTGSNFSASWDVALSEGSLSSSNRYANVLGDPTLDGTGAELRWAPANAIYTVIPEPSASLMIGLAGMALLLRRHRLETT